VIIETKRIKSLIDKHNCEKKALIAILQDIQQEYNYLPQKALNIVSQTLKMPMIDIIGVATFYSAFSLEPKGKHIATVCLGTACHVRGGPKVLDAFEKELGIPTGYTTEDGLWSLQTVACLGCCAIGPVVVVDGDYYAQTTSRKVGPIVKKYRKKEIKNEQHDN